MTAKKPAAKDRSDEQNRLIVRALAALASEQKGVAAQLAAELAATLPLKEPEH